MNDNYAKFEFEIQFLRICHKSNDDSVYTVSVGKIYSYFNPNLPIVETRFQRDVRVWEEQWIKL